MTNQIAFAEYPRATVDIQLTNYEPREGAYPRVAFDTQYAAHARKEGEVYDIDQSPFLNALHAGGMRPEDYQRYPTIIKPSFTAASAYAFWYNMGPPAIDQNAEQSPRIELYAGQGRFLSAKSVAHEARHMADDISGEVSISTRLMRGKIQKTAATVASVLVGIGTYRLGGGSLDLNAGNYLLAGESLVIADVSLCGLLMTQYMARKSERRARKAEGLVDNSNVLLHGQTNRSKVRPPEKLADRLKTSAKVTQLILKTLFVPDYTL